MCIELENCDKIEVKDVIAISDSVEPEVEKGQDNHPFKFVRLQINDVEDLLINKIGLARQIRNRNRANSDRKHGYN